MEMLGILLFTTVIIYGDPKENYIGRAFWKHFEIVILLQYKNISARRENIWFQKPYVCEWHYEQKIYVVVPEPDHENKHHMAGVLTTRLYRFLDATI